MLLSAGCIDLTIGAAFEAAPFYFLWGGEYEETIIIRVIYLVTRFFAGSKVFRVYECCRCLAHDVG